MKDTLIYCVPVYVKKIMPRSRIGTWPRAQTPKTVHCRMPSIEQTGRGTELFYDSYGGRWFRSSYEAVKECNEKYIEDYENGSVLSYSDWYDIQGLALSDFGYQYGYSPNEDWKVDLRFVMTRMTPEEFNRNCDWHNYNINECVTVVGPDSRCLPFEAYWEV